MNTTLNKIRAHGPCANGYKTLLQHLSKTQADDEALSIATVLDSNGLNDALWCLRAVTGHDREIRLYAVWCARQVQHLMTDPRSLNAIDMAERLANGQATADQLDNAYREATTRAARAARATAAEATAEAAKATAAEATAKAAWAAAAWAAAWAVTAATWAVADAAARGTARATARATAAREDMRTRQADKLREMCAGVAA